MSVEVQPQVAAGCSKMLASTRSGRGSHRSDHGRPHEFEGGEPRFAYVSRTLEVDKQQFEGFLASSRGRRSSGLFTAFLQPRDESEDLEGTESVPKERQHRSVFGIRMVSPYNVLAGIWTVFLTTVDASYTAFLVPIIVAFNSAQDSSGGIGNWSSTVEIIAGAVFLLDIFMNFHIGFIVRYDYKKKVVMDSSSVAAYYATHGGLWIDVISVVPLFLEVALIASSGHGGTSELTVSLRMFRLVRLIRLMRKVYMGAFSGVARGKATLFPWISSSLAYCLSVVYTLAFMVNALGCLLYFTARMEEDTDDEDGNPFTGTWLFEHKGETLAEDYLTSVYWAVTTITTVGYGDISPVTWIEQLIIMFLMVTHIMLFGLLIGSMSELVQSSTRKAKQTEQYKQKMACVTSWLRARRVSKSMAKKVHAYYAEIWIRNTSFDEDDILSELPTSLRGEIVFSYTKDLLFCLNVFKDVDEKALTQLAGRLVPIELPPGHELVRQGDPADSIFILEEGTLIVLQDEAEVERLKGATTCGESAILASEIPELSVRPVTLRARTACHMWELKVKDIEPLFLSYSTLKGTLAEGYRKSMVNKLNRGSLKHSALNDQVEAELGADLTGSEALDFKKLLNESTVADGTFPKLMKATLRRSRMIRGSVNDRITLYPPVEDDDSGTPYSPVSPISPQIPVSEPNMIIQHILLVLRSTGINAMLEFVDKVKCRSMGASLDQMGLTECLTQFELKPRQVMILFSHLDQTDSGLVDHRKLVDMIRFATLSGERQQHLIKIFELLDKKSAGSLDVMELVNRFSMSNHWDVENKRRTKSEVLLTMLRSFKNSDWISEEDFLIFNMDISVCVADTRAFLKLMEGIWNVKL